MIVEYVKCISRLWIVSFVISVMFQKSYLKLSFRLAQHEYGVKLATYLRPIIGTR
jgi:hypothetical protein